MSDWKVARQGELRFIRLPDDYVIPEGAKRVQPVNGKHIVGHSETGHHHVLERETTELYDLPESISKFARILVVEDPDILVHQRPYDTHESIAVPPGKYRVQVGREYVPGMQTQNERRSAD